MADWMTDEASGKSLNRPGIQAALERLENGGPRVLVVAKLDRIARSAIDFLGLVNRAEQNGWAMVMLEPNVDMTDPMGRFTAGILAQVAELERSLIARRTADAMAVAKGRGQRLGRPVSLPQDVRERIVAMRHEKATLAGIAAVLTAEAVPTARGGGRWYPSTVAHVLRSVELDRQSTRLSSQRGLA